MLGGMMIFDVQMSKQKRGVRGKDKASYFQPLHAFSSGDRAAHFGLGSYNKNVTVKVVWPSSGRTAEVATVLTNKVLTLIEPSGVSTDSLQEHVEPCPTLYIDSVNKQPTVGEIIINKDKTSVKYDPGKDFIIRSKINLSMKLECDQVDKWQ